MLSTLLFLLIHAPVSLNDLVLQEAQSTKLVVAFPVRESTFIDKGSSSLSELARNAQVTSVQRDKRDEYFVMDSSFLLPVVSAGPGGYVSKASAVGSLAGILGGGSERNLAVQMFSPNGLPSADLTPDERRGLGDIIGQPSWKDQIESGEGTFTADVQNQVVFTNEQGKVLGSANFLHCPDGFRDVIGLFEKNLDTEAQSRIPAELRNIVREHPSFEGGGIVEVQIRDLVKSLFQGNQKEVIVDKRLAMTKVVVGVPSSEISAEHLLDVSLKSLDVYFRKVGDLWFVGGSAGSPMDEAVKRARKKLNSAGGELSQVLTNAKVHSFGFDASKYDFGSRPLVDLTQEQVGKIIDSMSHCPGQDAKKLVDAIRANGVKGVQFRCVVGVDVGFRYKNNSVSIFLGG